MIETSKDTSSRAYEREQATTPWRLIGVETNRPQGLSRKPPTSPRLRD